MADRTFDQQGAGASRRSFASQREPPGSHPYPQDHRSPTLEQYRASVHPEHQCNQYMPASFEDLVNKFQHEVLKQRQFEATIRANHADVELRTRNNHEAIQDEIFRTLIATAKNMRAVSISSFAPSSHVADSAHTANDGQYHDDGDGVEATIEETTEKDSVLTTQDSLHRRHERSPSVVVEDMSFPGISARVSGFGQPFIPQRSGDQNPDADLVEYLSTSYTSLPASRTTPTGPGRKRKRAGMPSASVVGRPQSQAASSTDPPAK